MNLFFNITSVTVDALPSIYTVFEKFCGLISKPCFGPYVLSGGPLIFNVILFKRKAVYTEGAGPVCKCTGQCTLEGSILLF